jgi:protocatechuate 3,4-dioxygenase beta subunit
VGVAAVLLPVPLLAGPGQAATPIQQRVVDGGWVTGVVVDGHGQPVVGALVNAIGPGEVPELGIIADQTDRRDWTDAQGRFRVRQAEPGYLIQVCQPDERTDNLACLLTAEGVKHLITYVGPTGVTDSWVLQTSLFEPSSADRNVGTIKVKPQSYVHGHIARASSQQVELLRTNGTTAYRTQTDAAGNYRFQGLAPGHYRVGAGGEGWLRWRSPVFTVRPRQDVEVNGAVERGGRIHGVLSSAGEVVPFVEVMVRRVGGRILAAATTDEAGRYHVSGLRPGDYRVGITYDGTEYVRHGEIVTVPEPTSSVAAPIEVRKGAVITADLRIAGHPARGARDELRNGEGRPIQGWRNDNGQVTYPGLSRGTYTIVVANERRYAMTTVRITKLKTYDAGVLRLQAPTLTLSGTTEPKAVVEAMTGNQCPPDAADRPGSFHFIEQADDTGHYELRGLVPGNYMLGTDGWPQNYVPRCIPDVEITRDTVRDLPLKTGSVVTGRMVYASTGTPVITKLSYELTYPRWSHSNPTDEHPARDKTQVATGEFRIDALRAGTAIGALSQGADTDQITSPKYLVLYPFQDGTPYYLTSHRRVIDVPAARTKNLGDIMLHLHQ